MIALKNNEVAIVGYGSLTSIESMEKTLGRKYENIFYTTRLIGWQRNWHVFMPNTGDRKRFFFYQNDSIIYPQNILYLNITTKPKENVNCCLFIITKDELKQFDKREWIYDRVDVTNNLENVMLEGGKAYAYTANEGYRVDNLRDLKKTKFAVRQTYLNILDNAFKHLGDEYKKEFHETTITCPDSLIIKDFLE